MRVSCSRATQPPTHLSNIHGDFTASRSPGNTRSPQMGVRIPQDFWVRDSEWTLALLAPPSRLPLAIKSSRFCRLLVLRPGNARSLIALCTRDVLFTRSTVVGSWSPTCRSASRSLKCSFSMWLGLTASAGKHKLAAFPQPPLPFSFHTFTSRLK